MHVAQKRGSLAPDTCRRLNLRQNIGQWQGGGNLAGGRNAKMIGLQQRSNTDPPRVRLSFWKPVGYLYYPRKEWSDQVVPYYS